MKIFIDNNIWDYVYKNKIDLEVYFPKEKFKLCITQLGLYEIMQINHSNSEFKKFAKHYIEQYVFTDGRFGFYDQKFPNNEQRSSGFMGKFITVEESRFRKSLKDKYQKKKKRKDSNILFPQEADIELAVRSLEDVVITFDSKKGPLMAALQAGGKVIFLNHKESQGQQPHEFMSDLKSKISVYET